MKLGDLIPAWLRASRAPNAPADSRLSLTAAVEFLELEAAAESEGAAPRRPTFAISAYSGGPLHLPSQFFHPVILDLTGLKAARPQIPVLMDHDLREPVGQGKATIDATGVRIAGTVTGDDEPARRVVTHAKNGFQWQASIGATIERREFIEPGKTTTVNGRQVAGPAIIGRESTLHEVSFTALGADSSTSVRVAATVQPEETHMNFEQWLQANGFDPQTLTDAQRTTLRAAFDGQAAAAAPAAETQPTAPAPLTASAPLTTAPAVPTPDPIAAMRAEHIRCSEIDRICASHAAIRSQAIAEGWTTDRAELEVLRANRSAGPAIHVVSAAPANTQVLEAALCLSQPTIPAASVLACYGEQTTNLADRYRRLGLRRSIEMAASMSGVALPMQVDSQWIRAAFSSVEIAGIVGAVANRALAALMQSAAPVAPRISRAASHMNFHSHAVYSLGMSGELEKVAPDGELQHLSLSEESYTRQVETRGGLLRLTRTDIVNDEMGAFNDNALRMVRKAIVGREKALFSLINGTGAGASFFTSARGNYFEGAATLLSHSSLSTAVQRMREQTDVSGEPTLIEPRLLLVPPALEETAKALMDASSALIAVALGSTSSKAKEPSANVWAGKFEVVVSPWLGTTISASGSNTAWYLLGDPADVPAFEIAYLNGNQQPTIDFFGVESDPNTLGATWRIYWDFGAALAEYRAGVKSKGA